MKKMLITLATAMPLAAGAQSVYPTIGKLVTVDAKFSELLAPDAKVEVIASGFVWSEGPVWVKEGGYLLFSDVPENTIYRWTEKEGLSVFLKPSGYTGLGHYSDERGSNGLTIDSQGRLIACEHGDRRVSAMPLNRMGGKQTLADNYQGKRFNSPNDVVALSDGSYFFTDPPYGLPEGQFDQKNREVDVYGVYRISPPQADGSRKVTLVVSDLQRPNGVALSPDEKTLYVAQSNEDAFLMAYDIRSDGTLGKGRIFFDGRPLLKQGLTGGFDGLKTDRSGNVWSTGPGGLVVVSPQGKLLGRIEMGVATANCAWGDDGTTLYITADMYVCRVRTRVKGF